MKRQQSSINPNTVHGYLGPQETEINAGIDSAELRRDDSTRALRKSPLKTSMTTSNIKLFGLEHKKEASPINGRQITENGSAIENLQEEFQQMEIEQTKQVSEFKSE